MQTTIGATPHTVTYTDTSSWSIPKHIHPHPSTSSVAASVSQAVHVLSIRPSSPSQLPRSACPIVHEHDMAMHVPTLEAGGMEEEAHTRRYCTLTGGVTTDH